MKEYTCIKEFSIQVCDEDGFDVENEYINIEVGTVWHAPEDENYRFIGGEVRLESDSLGWIEITKEHLKEYFKLIQEYED